MPLLLAGPGAWLWTSAHVQTSETDSTVHGAFNGWIGYRSVEDLDAQVFRRHVLAGALWYDVERVRGRRRRGLTSRPAVGCVRLGPIGRRARSVPALVPDRGLTRAARRWHSRC
jgi:hypothetical protein